MNIDASEVKHHARGQWDRIIAALAPQLCPALVSIGRHCDCPMHGGHGDFRLFPDFLETGGGICTCGKFPDGLALLKTANNWSFKDTLVEVAEYLRLLPEQSHRPALPLANPFSGKDKEKEDAKIRRSLNLFWQQCLKGGAEAEKVLVSYFYRRGLRTNPLSLPFVRFHPNALYWDGDSAQEKRYFPAMVARVLGNDGKALTLHRTFLTPDGVKADVPSPKKLMRHVSTETLHGAAIRLESPGKHLAVAEGIETSVAVMELTGIPCWSVVNACLMEHFVPPAGVEHLHIFADNDRVSTHHPQGHGQEAAESLARKLCDSGIKTSVHVPPLVNVLDGCNKADWLDVLAKLRNDSFS